MILGEEKDWRSNVIIQRSTIEDRYVCLPMIILLMELTSLPFVLLNASLSFGGICSREAHYISTSAGRLLSVKAVLFVVCLC